MYYRVYIFSPEIKNKTKQNKNKNKKKKTQTNKNKNKNKRKKKKEEEKKKENEKPNFPPFSIVQYHKGRYLDETNRVSRIVLRGYSTPRPYYSRLCAFSEKNKTTLDKVSYGSGQKCSKELKNHSFTLKESIVVKLQEKICENQYFPCLIHK